MIHFQPSKTLKVAIIGVLTIYTIASACDMKPKEDKAASNDNALPTAQTNHERWEYSTDSNFAKKYPDAYAWQLFRAFNWPADTTTMGPDTTLPFGGDTGTVVWQTWKSAVETFLPDGTSPGAWNDKDFGPKTSDDFSSFSLKAQITDVSKDPTFGIEDIALSEGTYNYIVENQLYNLDGQVAVYNSSNKIQFPSNAFEIKVKWREIPNTDYAKARYHWQYITFKDSGKVETKLFGMAAMHISSRIIANWVWATFEHIDSRSQLHPGDDGWLLTSHDRFSCDEPPYDCELAPRNFGLEGTKWEYYRLRGTQTDYLDDQGDTSLLANSNVERGFQMSSSCITCHSLASIGPIDSSNNQMQRVNFIRSLMTEDGQMYGGRGYIGIPNQKLFDLPNGQKMRHADFVYTLMRAQWLKKDSTSANP